MPALPPAPDGLRAALGEDFVTAPAARIRLAYLALAAVAVLLAYRAALAWGGSPPAYLAGLLAAAGWAAAVVAQWSCLRRDLPLLLSLDEARAEESDRGLISLWRLAEPVPARLQRREAEEPWATSAAAGDQIPVRLQESGFGLLSLVYGTPTVDGWRLPPPRRRVPPLALVYFVAAVAAWLVAGRLALAPSRLVPATVRQARQEPWTVGLGQEPWRLLLDAEGEPREVEIRHAQLLELLSEPGRRALAAPGLIPSAAERERQYARYAPIGERVRLRLTELGPWRAVVFVGPEP